MKLFLKSEKGQSLVELLVTIGLAAVLLPSLLTGFAASRNGRAQQDQRLQAIGLVKEAQEAVRVVREKDWTSFAAYSTGALYHPVAASSWTLVSGSESINGLTRQVVINDVCRDINGMIASTCTGNTLDPSTKKITITVSWGTPTAASVNTTEYLTRYTNQSYAETTSAQFQSGTYTSSIAITNTSGGEVALGPGVTNGDWCKPQTSVVATFDLPGNGVTVAISAATGATQDVAYTTTGGNSSGDPVDKLTISHASPPVVANPNSITSSKAYGIFTDGTYIYFNQNNPPNHTVQIAQASNLSLLGFFDVNKATGTSVYVSGNTGFVTAGSTLYSFDVSSKTGSRPQLGSVGLAGAGNRVIIVGNNAYVATTSTTSQLQIINVSDPTHMSIIKSINLGNSMGGVDVYANSSQTYAYIVTSLSSGKNYFYIVDLANTNNKWGYTTANPTNPTGIIVPAANRAIVVGSGGEEYQVFDVSLPGSASRCGGMSPSGVSSINAISGVVQNSGNVFSYIITNNTSAEFQVIQGGPGGSTKYATSGTFESQTFDTGHDVAFNNFSVNALIPASTSIAYAIAIKHGVVSGGSTTCTGVTFSNADFIAITPGQIPLSTSTYANPGQCLRYRAILSTTDTNQTPILNDITFNYSP